MPELSVIIPILNEEENIAVLSQRIQEALGDIDHEVIWVDDGSTDESAGRAVANATENTTILILDRNYGQSAAMQAGIDHSSGDFIAFLDGDLQNDPSDILSMLSLIKTGNWDLVTGKRKQRKDSLVTKRIPSAIANWVIRLVSGSSIRDFGCTLKIMRRDIAMRLFLEKGMHRFIPILVKNLNGKITQTEVRHHPRIHGRSKYGLGRTTRVIKDLFRVTRQSKDKNRRPGTPLYHVSRIIIPPTSRSNPSGIAV